jgi:hypothetical protein
MHEISLGGSSLPSGEFYPLWTILIDNLVQAGLSIKDEAAFHVSLDHEESSYQKFILGGGKPKNAILVRLETNTVFPGQYSPRIESKYGFVLTFGANSKLRNSTPALGHPYVHSKIPTFRTRDEENRSSIFESRISANVFKIEKWKNRATLISYIGGNKIGLNSTGNYNYRRKLVRTLIPKGLKVYGPYWNDGFWVKFYNRSTTFLHGLRSHQIPNFFHIYGDLFNKYPGAMGRVAEKDVVLLDSKFTLVIENSNDILTEKLFDALLAGSIPIFFGPDLSDYGLPDNISIELRGNERDILTRITEMPDNEVDEYLNNIIAFLNDQSQFGKWVAEYVFQETARLIYQYIVRESGNELCT